MQWENLVLRLKNEARSLLANNKQNGVAIVTVHLLMDAEGTPRAWVVPAGKRIEPSSSAAQIIATLAEEF